MQFIQHCGALCLNVDSPREALAALEAEAVAHAVRQGERVNVVVRRPGSRVCVATTFARGQRGFARCGKVSHDADGPGEALAFLRRELPRVDLEQFA